PGRARCRSRATAGRPRRRGRAVRGAWPGRPGARSPCGCRPRSAPRPAPLVAVRAARSAPPPCRPLPVGPSPPTPRRAAGGAGGPRPRGRHTTEPVAAPPERVEAPPVEIAPNDPLIAYFSGATGAVDFGALQLDSPALEGLREAGIKLVVPLVSQGELIGLLNLGP